LTKLNYFVNLILSSKQKGGEEIYDCDDVDDALGELFERAEDDGDGLTNGDLKGGTLQMSVLSEMQYPSGYA